MAQTLPSDVKTKIFCMYGGPGTGKSTVSTGAFSYLKERGVNAEYVPEYIKELAWEDRKIVTLDQFATFGEQTKREVRLMGKVDVVLTDAPLWIQAYYVHAFGTVREAQTFAEMCHTYYAMCTQQGVEHIHIWLNRVKPYNPKGRFQTEENAKAIDVDMRTFLGSQDVQLLECDGVREDVSFMVRKLLGV